MFLQVTGNQLKILPQRFCLLSLFLGYVLDILCYKWTHPKLATIQKLGFPLPPFLKGLDWAIPDTEVESLQ